MEEGLTTFDAMIRNVAGRLEMEMMYLWHAVRQSASNINLQRLN